MPILDVSAGVVTAVRGEAFVRSPEGALVPVRVGDRVEPGQLILDAAGDAVETIPGSVANVAAVSPDLDQVITNLDQAVAEEDAPAAGLAGGEGSLLGPGLRVDRVSETVGAQSFGSESATQSRPGEVQAAPLTDQRVLTASVDGDPAPQPPDPQPQPGPSPIPQPPVPPVPAPLPSLVIDGVSETEGEPVLFNVRLTTPSNGPVTISLNLLPGSDAADAAEPGLDTSTSLEYRLQESDPWLPVSGNLTFPAGSTLIQVQVATVDDLVVEPTEYIQLQATVVSGETANSITSNDTAITDDDKPFVVVYGQDGIEGDYVGFMVNLTQASPEGVVVSLALLPGSDPVDAAQPDVDTSGPLEYFDTQSQQWLAVTDNLTIPAGETQIAVRVKTADDAELEGVEYLRLQATVVEGNVANDPAEPPANDVAITDNDAPFMVVLSDNAIEGRYANFSVNLTSATNEVISVSLGLQYDAAADDAAQPGVDSLNEIEFFNASTQQWELVTGPLSFQPGDTRIEVRVQTVDDTDVESVEYLQLQATVVQGSVRNPNSVALNDSAITDNDGREVLGTDQDEMVLGQAGDDSLQALSGSDLLYGGQGDDVLNGGDGSDVFAWQLSDVVDGVTTVDRIEDFSLLPPAEGGDVLDLRDLLQGENALGGTGNLTQYLRFDTSSGADTVIEVNVLGEFGSQPDAVNQQIVLQGVNLRAEYGLDASSGDAALIARMLSDQKLLVDLA